MRRRSFAFLLAISLAGAGAVSCSSRGGDGALELISHSADAAAEVGTYAFEMSFDMELPDAASGSVSMTGDGEVDEAVPAARMHMQIASGGQSTSFDTSFEMIFVGTVFYMRFGDLGAALGVPTPWISLDVTDVPGLGDLLGGGAGSSDPTATLDYLRGAGDVTELGSEDVRGVSTTHYSAVVNFQDALDATPEDQREGMRQFLDALPAELDLDALEFPIEVWIDGDGLPRRMHMELDLGKLAPGALPDSAAMSMTMELFDFGEDVSIEAPPTGEVTDITDLSDLSGVLEGQLGGS